VDSDLPGEVQGREASSLSMTLCRVTSELASEYPGRPGLKEIQRLARLEAADAGKPK
jgi:hypothetical protein